MARLGPSGLAQLFREIANYVSTRLSNYNTKAELDSLLDTKADDNNVIHTSGTETIDGIKTFTSGPRVTNNQTTMGYSITNTAIARNEVPSQLYHATFRAYDKNSKILGEYCVEKSTSGDSLLNMGVRSEDDSGTQIAYGLQFRMTNDGSLVRFLPSANNKVHLGDPSAKWLKVHSDDVVHTTGTETIEDTKKFTADVARKCTAVDITTTPASDMYVHFNFTDKNDKTVAYIQYSQRTNGVDYIGLRVRDKNSTTWGVQINTNKEFVPLGNNSYSLGSSSYKWGKIYSDDIVHTTGDETIAGTKTFSDRIISDKELHYKDTQYDWSNTSLNTWCDAGHVAWFDKTGNRRMHELVGAQSGVWRKACYINENQYFSVDSNRNIIYWGNTTFNGITIFTTDMVYLNNEIDLTVTPSSTLFSNFIFKDKNHQIVAFLQYAKCNVEPDILGLYINDKDKNPHGIQITSNNYLLPMGNNIWNLGDVGAKWANVYSTNNITNKVITYSVTNHDNTSSMTVSGGSSWDTGSTLFLYGNSHSDHPGAFNLTAKNTTNESKLIGFPNGTLTWGGQAIATTAYVKSQGYVTLTSLAGGNSAGSLKHSVGSLVLAYCEGTAFSGTTYYGNVAGHQLCPCRTEIYTSYSYGFMPIIVRSYTGTLGAGTWRYLGGSNLNFNNAVGEIYGMFLRVA